ncbi:B12-binding domain-containing radical SAM protein, partial [Patescibacteria group bacterium]|nr:B12-binding domain-containing radical SAM protein [Patescibacteria group bacterium]
LVVPDRPYLLEQKSLPNLGVLYVSSALKSQGHEVKVLDFADGWKFVDADRYGISVTTPDFPRAVEIARWIKSRKPEARIIAGGPHASLCPEDFTRELFDTICVGDGEACVRELDYDNGVIRRWLQDIDEFHPNRDAIDLWNYNFKVDGKRASTMLTSRGCAKKPSCVFCSRWDDHVRYHSVDYVKQEVEDIVDRDFGAIALYDDEFFTFPKRDKQIIELLGEHQVAWRCFGHSKYVLKNRELVEQASRSGLREVLLGIESGSDGILSAINKGATVEMNEEAIKILHSFKISVKAALIVGLPGESEKTLKETEEFCERVSPFVDMWDFCPFAVYPGSEVYKHPERFDIKFDKRDIYRAYKGMNAEGWEPPHISTSNLSFERIIEQRDKLERRFKHA